MLDLSSLEIPDNYAVLKVFFFFFLRWREDQWGGESRAPEVIGF